MRVQKRKGDRAAKGHLGDYKREACFDKLRHSPLGLFQGHEALVRVAH